MSLPPPLIWITALVALQRLAELWWANRNTKRLLARGGREVGQGHYGVMVFLHVGWLAMVVLTTHPDAPVNWMLLGLYVMLQVGRLWVITSLGEYWTTRIITLDEAPLVRKGPYRFLKHPNYWIVAAEIAVLPLAFGNWAVALVFSVLNAWMLVHRIRIEQAALKPREAA